MCHFCLQFVMLFFILTVVCDCSFSINHQHVLYLVFLTVAIVTGVPARWSIAHYGLDLHFPEARWHWALSYTCWPFVLLWKIPSQVVCSVFIAPWVYVVTGRCGSSFSRWAQEFGQPISWGHYWQCTAESTVTKVLSRPWQGLLGPLGKSRVIFTHRVRSQQGEPQQPREPPYWPAPRGSMGKVLPTLPWSSLGFAPEWVICSFTLLRTPPELWVAAFVGSKGWDFSLFITLLILLPEFAFQFCFIFFSVIEVHWKVLQKHKKLKAKK